MQVFLFGALIIIICKLKQEQQSMSLLASVGASVAETSLLTGLASSKVAIPGRRTVLPAFRMNPDILATVIALFTRQTKLDSVSIRPSILKLCMIHCKIVEHLSHLS